MNALRGDDITINGDGSQTRSFCYVSDMVDGLVRLMHSNLRGPVNLGNQVETSIMELAERINVPCRGPVSLGASSDADR